MSDTLDQALAKIRPHSSSSLPHQKTPATLLHALEATFREQNTQPSSTAYFAALVTTLDGALRASPASGPSLGDGDVLSAVLYLLALVSPYVPPPVIRSHLSTIISLTSPLFPALMQHAPPLKSQLGLYAAVFQALEKQDLDSQGLSRSFTFILQFVLDPRPKVRKKAVELVQDVLASPPPPMLRHPYAQRVADWTISALAEVNQGGMPKSKGKKAEPESADSALHLLAFLRPVLVHLPPVALPQATSSLLLLPRLGNTYLSQSAFNLLSSLLTLAAEDPANGIHAQLPEMVTAILSSAPGRPDTTLSPAWAEALSHTVLALHSTDADACATELPRTWRAIWALLEAEDTPVRKAAVQALSVLAKCLPPANGGSPASIAGKFVAQASRALDSLAFARAVPEVLAVVSALVAHVQPRSAVEALLLPLVVRIGSLRIQQKFEHKEAADGVLRTAMRVLGPKVLLDALPLNIEPSDRQAGREPRAFLLPLLAQPHPSPLSHFVEYFVPLTERMFDWQQAAEAAGRASEAKVWQVLVYQIWIGFPGYCWVSPDLQHALTQQFSQLLSQLLYTQPQLRPSVLKALKTIAESNTWAAAGEDARLPEWLRGDLAVRERAQANVQFLRAQAGSWLAVLFNVFSSVNRDAQGHVGDVVRVWTTLAGEQEIAGAYVKLIEMFKQNLAKTNALNGKATPELRDAANVTTVTQDLIVLVLPYLSSADATALFSLCLSNDVLENKDGGVQKRGYEILVKLAESKKVDFDPEIVLKRLEETLDGLAVTAKKHRFRLYKQLVPTIPSSHLQYLLTIIPEAVLGTKEPTQKTRNAAFDLIVLMGRKMAEGGAVQRSAVDDMDQDGAPEAKGNIEEYMTMIAGGLAGATPHMISATITAISRLVFEFKDQLSGDMQTEIFTTLLVFVSSANREIVKSALGFVKLAIHTMPVDLLRPHLPQLVSALLLWSHDHKNHFKVKARHIFERMIRRFGWEDVYACAVEEDARKVLANVKKRKDRAKRKKALRADEDDDDEEPAPKVKTGEAFEDVLYGSESELDSDDELPADNNPRSGKPKDNNKGIRLRADDDDPMDLLQGAAAHVTNAQAVKRRKPGQDAAKFKTDEATGKLIIEEEDSDDAGDEAPEDNLYKESLTSVDGFTRGPNGRIKFNKDTKKRRRENEEDEDVEMADGNQSAPGKSKRKPDVKLGHEFKAKKAGGDVKKGGVEPYAYLSLSQAAKKKGRGNRVGIVGKR
ncbi:NUC173-domain-containing protein [Wolfiporia cocos MD-104 SS10]|uniref:NUC173-domain-containing protein n=1 Tax=Wolfiporia cocos (strain MD-104) TaxID=742152 RepID=A0A2H3JX26_WOLCO|nr:NUC173-domain-containing protein [Wolfiporia cocos MD-104 SS10]